MNTSTMRGILLSPTIFPFGMYATCALPKNGSIWCSHMLKKSMSFTITISLYFSLKTASFRTFLISFEYPSVRNCRAFATRWGVADEPLALRILAELAEHVLDKHLQPRRRSGVCRVRSRLHLLHLFHAVILPGIRQSCCRIHTA